MIIEITRFAQHHMCLHFTHHVLKVFSERPFCLRHIYGHDDHQLFSHYHPCHTFTLTTSLLIYRVTMMATPLLISSPPACSHSYTLTNILSLSLFHFVSCIHYTSSTSCPLYWPPLVQFPTLRLALTYMSAAAESESVRQGYTLLTTLQH